MAILIDKNSKVLVQGITGKSGQVQTKNMIYAGTNVVAGVTPGRGGQTVNGVPVYNFIEEAREKHDFDVAVSFVPAKASMDSLYEAVDAGVKLAIITTEEIAEHEVVKMIEYAKVHGVKLYGPGCAGIISPGQASIGAHPINLYSPGHVGVVSKSGSMSYLMGKTLTDAGIGQSTVAAIGGGPFWGYTMRDAIEDFNKDPDTHVIVLLGEMGGNQEELAAEYIKENQCKPVVSLITGRHAPAGKRMGHAGAIVRKNVGTAEGKNKILSDAGVKVATSLIEVLDFVKANIKDN